MGIEVEGRLAQGFVGDEGVNAPGMDCEAFGMAVASALGLVGVTGGGRGDAGRSSDVGRCWNSMSREVVSSDGMNLTCL